MIQSTMSYTCMPTPTLKDKFTATRFICIGRMINKTPPILSYDSTEFILEVEEAFKVR